MKRVRQFAVVMAVAAMLAVTAIAQDSKVFREGNGWSEETTGVITSAEQLRVTTSLGNVRIEGGAGPNITYRIKKTVYGGSEQSARQQMEQLRITAGRSGDTALLQGIGTGRFHRMSAEFVVQVPRNLESARATTQGGNITVTGITGEAVLASGGGNLRVDDIGGDVKASSGGGNVDVGTVHGDAHISTGGGNISIASAHGEIHGSSGGGNVVIGSSLQGIHVSTGGGSIEVKKCGGDLKAATGGGSLEVGTVAGSAAVSTGGGSIRLSSASGPVTAKSGGGSIELYGLSSGAPRVLTGGGNIVAEFVPGNFTGSSLETPAGDIVVFLSPDLRATIRAVIDVANGHTINVTPFNKSINVRTEGGQYGPRTVYAEGNLNGGGPVLLVHTTSGDINFKLAKR